MFPHKGSLQQEFAGDEVQERIKPNPQEIPSPMCSLIKKDADARKRTKRSSPAVIKRQGPIKIELRQLPINSASPVKIPTQ